MEQLRHPQASHTLGLMGLSLLIHALLLVTLDFLPKPKSEPQRLPVAVKVVTKPKAEPAAPPPPPSPAPKPEVQPKAPPQARSTSASKPDSPPTAPVLGLSPESFSKDGTSGISVPAGNTTMAPDEGKRLSPEDIQKLGKNLSQDAELIPQSFVKPSYTQEAEDAGLEGRFVVEVFVNAAGDVTDAELRNKVGYGMDQRILESARKAKFKPRRDAKGQAVEGWTEIKIRLTLD